MSEFATKRKRKLSQQTFFKTTNITLNKNSYNCLNEHNYFHDVKKKNNRWPGLISTNNNNNFDSLPNWLKGYNSSSDEEDEIEIKSLAHLLKMEFEKDLEYSNQSNERVHNLLSNDETILNKSQEDKMVSNSNHNVSDKQTEFKSKVMDTFGLLNVSKETKYLLNRSTNHVVYSEEPEDTLKILLSEDETIFKRPTCYKWFKHKTSTKHVSGV